MASTIRISPAGKRALETLRRRWQRAEGKSITQEEAAGRAFAILAEHPDLAAPRTRSWTKRQWELVQAIAVTDPAVRADDVDETLYGETA